MERNSLHKVIHSLSASDKAHFKKYSKIFIAKGDTKLKIYYKILEKMKAYSRNELNLQLEKYGGKRAFKNTEKELYDELLQHLVVLKSKTTPQSNYFMEHMKMRYLFDMNMHDECSKHYEVLEKAREVANNTFTDYFYYSYRYHALNFLRATKNHKDIEAINQVEHELKKLADEINLEVLVTTARNNFNNLRLTNRSKSKREYLQELENFEQQYLNNLPNSVDDFRLQLQSSFYFLLCVYFEQKQDFENLDVYSKKFYKKFDSVKNEKTTDKHQSYVLSVAIRSNYLTLTKNTEAYDIIERFKKFLDENEFVEMKGFHYTMYYNLAMFAMVQFNDLHRLASFIAANQADYDTLTKANVSPSQLTGDLFWAYGFFKLKHFDKAQPYLDKIFNANKKINDIYNAVYISARVLDILIHFELRNHESIDYFIKNLENEMKRKNHLIPFDKAFFGRLKKLNKQLFAKEKIDTSTFIDFLEESKNDDRFESYLTMIDLKSWLLEISSRT